jgi:hypothetical protein
MSYRSRESKRKKKAAMSAAQSKAKATGSTSRWWLTLTTRDTCCARCALVLRIGTAMVYRSQPREALCPACAETAEVRFRPSVAWEQRRTRPAVDAARARRGSVRS